MMKFSENNNLVKVFGEGYRGYSAKELDRYFDAIEADPEAQQLVAAASSKAVRQSLVFWNEPATSMNFLDDIARKHEIDTGHHSGGSFQTLKNDILAIMARGGRDTAISASESNGMAL